MARFELTSEELAELIKRYQDGASATQIAAEYGKGTNWFLRRLRAANVPVRNQHAAAHKRLDVLHAQSDPKSPATR